MGTRRSRRGRTDRSLSAAVTATAATAAAVTGAAIGVVPRLFRFVPCWRTDTQTGPAAGVAVAAGARTAATENAAGGATDASCAGLHRGEPLAPDRSSGAAAGGAGSGSSVGNAARASASASAVNTGGGRTNGVGEITATAGTHSTAAGASRGAGAAAAAAPRDAAGWAGEEPPGAIDAAAAAVLLRAARCARARRMPSCTRRWSALRSASSCCSPSRTA